MVKIIENVLLKISSDHHRLELDVRQMENNNDGSVGFLSGFYTACQDCKISIFVRAEFGSIECLALLTDFAAIRL